MVIVTQLSRFWTTFLQSNAPVLGHLTHWFSTFYPNLLSAFTVPNGQWPTSVNLHQKGHQLQTGDQGERPGYLLPSLHPGHTLGLAVSVSLCDWQFLSSFLIHCINSHQALGATVLSTMPLKAWQWCLPPTVAGPWVTAPFDVLSDHDCTEINGPFITLSSKSPKNVFCFLPGP